MWPVAVVMVDEDLEDPLEILAVEDQQPVETLGSDGADEAFGDCVRLRRSQRVGFANSGGVVFVEESAEEVATTEASSRIQRRWVTAARR